MNVIIVGGKMNKKIEIAFGILLVIFFIFLMRIGLKKELQNMSYIDCLNYKIQEFKFKIPKTTDEVLIFQSIDWNVTLINASEIMPMFSYTKDATSKCLYIGYVENLSLLSSAINLTYHKVEIRNNRIVKIK